MRKFDKLIFEAIVFVCFLGCDSSNKSETQDKLTNPKSLVVQIDTNISSKSFSAIFFSLLDSVGFEIDSVKSFNEQEIKPYKVSQLFTWYHRVNYDDSIFEFKIINLKCSFISRVDSLMTKEQNKMEWYKGLLGLKEITFKDSSTVAAIKRKYNTILNLDLDVKEGEKRITRTYYDFNNHKIWFLYDRSLKSSKQFNTIADIISQVEQNLE